MEVKRSRQNSIPTLRASPVTRSVRIMEEKKRRKSYDVRPIQAAPERYNPNALFFSPQHPQWPRGKPRRSNAALNSASSSFSYPSRGHSKRNSSSAFVINYGFASAGYHFRGRGQRIHRYASSSSSNNVNNEGLEQPSTSSIAEEEDFEAVLDEPEEDTQSHQHMAVFFIHYSDHRILPIYCHRPMGSQADEYIESLSDKHKDCLKKFLEKEKPDDGECYLWIREDATMKTTVLSLKTLENHFKNSERVRRVKWRHLSVDRISIYRYSLPIISTKFRVRVAHFLSRNYRCCILCVWCLVILFVSTGIVLSVVFGHMKSTANMTFTATSSLFSMQQGRGANHPPPPPTFILKDASMRR